MISLLLCLIRDGAADPGVAAANRNAFVLATNPNGAEAER
jgi:hypothetical protein